MILLISTNSEPLHDLEFVTPIEQILSNQNKKFISKNYLELTKKDLQNADKIIICGTSLKDNQFLKDLKSFGWIRRFGKPILGICAGMQVISLIFGAKAKKQTEIGFYEENFKKEFLSLIGKHEVYHLHNNFATLPKNFISFTDSKIPQAIKHQSGEIYGVLFHPEVRNRKLIEEFCRL